MRVFNYLVIMMGLIVLFNLAGLPTASHKLLEAVNIVSPTDEINPEGITLSDYFSGAFGLISGLVVVGTLIMGLYMKSSPESYLLIPYEITLFLFIADMVSILTLMKGYENWAYYLVVLITLPLIIGYIHSIISWWGNKA